MAVRLCSRSCRWRRRNQAPIWIGGRQSVWFRLRMEEKRRQAAALQTNGAPTGSERRCRKLAECGRKLDGLGCRCGCRRVPGKCIPAGFLFWTLVDLDGAFEVGAVFDHDAGSSQVTVSRTILFDFKSILRAKVALHVAVHHYLAGNDVGGHFRRGPDSQLPLIELNQSFD